MTTEVTQRRDRRKDLKKVRNVKPMWSKLGLAAIAGWLGGLDMWTNHLRFLALWDA